MRNWDLRHKQNSIPRFGKIRPMKKNKHLAKMMGINHGTN
jgi:hypothetical protein